MPSAKLERGGGGECIYSFGFSRSQFRGRCWSKLVFHSVTCHTIFLLSQVSPTGTCSSWLSAFNRSFNCPDSLPSQYRVSQMICPVLNWNGVGEGSVFNFKYTNLIKFNTMSYFFFSVAQGLVLVDQF